MLGLQRFVGRDMFWRIRRYRTWLLHTRRNVRGSQSMNATAVLASGKLLNFWKVQTGAHEPRGCQGWCESDPATSGQSEGLDDDTMQSPD